MNAKTDAKELEKPTGLALLRAPFPAHQISKLPKPYKKDSQKGNCKECGGYHGLPAAHLDYVGHAALTDRLLEADPTWSWEPLALRDGLPAFDENGGLWIKLTVCGVTRLGYGNAEHKTYMDRGAREKEVIGDALRNAAMRFGAALDLWHKGDLHEAADATDEQKPGDVAQQVASANVKPNADAGKNLTQEQRGRIDRLADEVLDAAEQGYLDAGYDAIEAAALDAEEKLYLWSKLGSVVRTGLKKIAKKRLEESGELATQA